MIDGTETDTHDVRFAGFWIRGAAFVIDFFLLNFVSWLVELILLGAVYWGSKWTGHPLPAEQGLESMLDPVTEQMVSVAIFLGSSGVYFVCGYYLFGTSVGKKALGLRVVRSDDFGPISLWQAIRRCIGYAISWAPMGAGFLMAAFNPRRRALHDWLAGTVVIRSGRRATPPFTPEPSGPPDR